MLLSVTTQTIISYELHKELIIPHIFMQKPYFCKVLNWESKIQVYPQKWVSWKNGKTNYV